ncbi:MAG: tetratricopeptide repeat protein, partial [Calditrichaceae bacterium]
MESLNLHLLSTYLKKWSFDDNRIALNYSFCHEAGYERSRFETRIGSPSNMANDFLNNVFHTAKEKILQEADNNGTENLIGSNIFLVNESEVKRKLGVFLSKINREFNQNKRSRGRSRMISTRSLDFYYNDFEFEPLEDRIKFYVHLNRGINKMNGDLWSNAVDDFTLALEIDPAHVEANRYMSEALGNLGRYEEAIDYLKVYAEAKNTPESLGTLANLYTKLEDYKSAEQILKKMTKDFPDSDLALFGLAQLAYKQGKPYISLLNKLWKKNPLWLQEKMKSDWEYKLPQYEGSEEGMWNAATTARYLGFERPYDLTRRAFNDQVPSYFDSEKGTIRFVKSELDAWVDHINRYDLDVEKYETYEDKLTKEEKKVGRLKKRKRPRRIEEKVDEEV